MSEISSFTTHNSLNSNTKISGGSLDGGSLDKFGDLKAAAVQFESIFLKMFLDQARDAKLSDEILGSSAMIRFRKCLTANFLKAPVPQ